jgi:hypothetical protein
VSQFRKLMLAVFGSGALAGLVLFALQHFTVVPLIQAAETYEAAGQEAHPGAPHEDEGWQPAQGWERTSFTALTTVLTGIGFAAMLFGVMALAGKTINTRHGALWGLRLLPPSVWLRRSDYRLTSGRRGGTLASTPALVGGDGNCDRRRRMLGYWAEAKLAAPSLWSSVHVASTLDWCTRGHRTERCSG